MIRIRTGAWALALTILFLASAYAREKAIVIFIGKKPLDLKQCDPAVLTDDMFVPARSVAEAAGAKVHWDKPTGTMTITSASGVGALTVGSHWGRIRGTKVYFPYWPYVWGNQCYAPMLFFNEMFDQAWYFDPYYGQFRWVPIFPRFRGGLRPPMVIPGPGRHAPEDSQAPEGRSGSGCTVRPLPSEKKPKIVIQIGSSAVTYPLAKGALILRGSIGKQASESPLSAIRPGDYVTFQRNARGEITALRAQYRIARGKVKSVGAGGIVLETGDRLPLSPQTEILMSDNKSGAPADIKVGDTIAASLSPKIGNAYLIQVQKGGRAVQEGEEEGQVCLNSYGPLTTGDELVVWFKANAGGQAWFTIPGVKANIPMKEAFPGYYSGSYTIQQGDIAVRQLVKVTFTMNDGQTFVRLTSRPLTIGTVCDYLPRITNPRQGQQIVSPVIVIGEAQPGSLVRIVIEFRRNAQSIFPIQGVTAIQDVNADSNGDWRTPPLSAIAPFSDNEPPVRGDFGVLQDWFSFVEEPPTVYTITAIAIGPNGQERTAYRIEVTKEHVTTVGGLTPSLVELRAGL